MVVEMTIWFVSASNARPSTQQKQKQQVQIKSMLMQASLGHHKESPADVYVPQHQLPGTVGFTPKFIHILCRNTTRLCRSNTLYKPTL